MHLVVSMIVLLLLVLLSSAYAQPFEVSWDIKSTQGSTVSPWILPDGGVVVPEYEQHISHFSKNGTLIWNFTTLASDAARVNSVLVIGSNCFIGGSDGILYKIHTASGVLGGSWNFGDTIISVTKNPNSSNDLFVVVRGADRPSFLYRFDIGVWTTTWSQPICATRNLTIDWPLTGMVVDSENVYLSCFWTNSLESYSVVDGSLFWSFDFGDFRSFNIPFLEGDGVLVGTSSDTFSGGKVFKIYKDTGNEAWNFETNAGIRDEVLFFQGRGLVVDLMGYLYNFDIYSGVSDTPFKILNVTGMTMVDETVWIGTRNQVLLLEQWPDISAIAGISIEKGEFISSPRVFNDGRIGITSSTSLYTVFSKVEIVSTSLPTSVPTPLPTGSPSALSTFAPTGLISTFVPTASFSNDQVESQNDDVEDENTGWPWSAIVTTSGLGVINLGLASFLWVRHNGNHSPVNSNSKLEGPTADV